MRVILRRQAMSPGNRIGFLEIEIYPVSIQRRSFKRLDFKVHLILKKLPFLNGHHFINENHQKRICYRAKPLIA